MNRKGKKKFVPKGGAGLVIIMLLFGLLSSATSHALLDGVPVEASSYRNVVALLAEGTVVGSGALVSENKINTAGHCILDDLSLDYHFGCLSRLLSVLGEGFIKDQNALFLFVSSISSMEEKRRELDRYFNAILENRKAELRIYFGSGTPGGRVKGEDIIDRIVVHEDWIEILRYQFFQSFDALEEKELLMPTEQEERYMKAIDFAEIYLNKKIDTEEVKIIPPFSASEYNAYRFTGTETIRLVGFGTTTTFGARDYSNRFGVKTQLDVALNGTLGDGDHDFKVVGATGRSAGDGDSGGAAFVKLNDGRWRYLGVIIAAGPCVGSDYLFRVDKSSVRGTTLLYTRQE